MIRPSSTDRLPLYLSIGAVVTLIELAFPNIVPLGFLLLGVPGALLWITPSALIYGSIAALIWRGIPRYRHLKLYMIATSLFAVGIALPETLNHLKNISISKLQQDDIILIQEPTLPDTIAFLFAPAGFNRKEANEINGSTFFNHEISCGEVCQRLLYNGSVRRVIISTSSDNSNGLPDGDTSLAAFRLERRAACPPAVLASPGYGEYWPEGAYAEFTNIRVRKRIAAGECLIRENAPLKDAKLIYIERKFFLADEESSWSLSANLHTLHRIELLRRSDADIVPLYRSSYVDSSSLSVPLIFGVTEMSLLFGASTGFLREFDFPKVPSVDELAQSMFGAAARMPLPLEPDPYSGIGYLCGPSDVTCQKFWEP